MNKAEIQEHIKRLKNGRAATSDAHQIELIDLGLSKYRKMLADLEKKSEEPTGKTGELERQNERRLPTKEEIQAWEKGMERDSQNQAAIQQQTAKAFETRVSVGRASETSVTVPAVFVKIAGEDRLLTQTEIVGYLKTYFKRVATSERMKGGQYTAAYASDMGKTVWRLFDGWNLIYKETQEGSEWPPMVDIFPGWKNAQQAHKVTADVLWRWASNRKQ
jgi:hypothetical protein